MLTLRLSQSSTDSTTTLCLNNLPPIFKCEGYTVTFFAKIFILFKSYHLMIGELFSRLKESS